MLTATPASIFGWDFEINGPEPALGSINWLGESGQIRIGNVMYDVVKQGWLSGQWTLESRGDVYARGVRSGILTRTIEITGQGQRITLRAQTPFTRGFDVEADGRHVGTVVPDHAFTRRSTITMGASVPLLMQVFAFWLIALQWRRAARN